MYIIVVTMNRLNTYHHHHNGNFIDSITFCLASGITRSIPNNPIPVALALPTTLALRIVRTPHSSTSTVFDESSLIIHDCKSSNCLQRLV